jgi:hypothetical protein
MLNELNINQIYNLNQDMSTHRNMKFKEAVGKYEISEYYVPDAKDLKDNSLPLILSGIHSTSSQWKIRPKNEKFPY